MTLPGEALICSVCAKPIHAAVAAGEDGRAAHDPCLTRAAARMVGSALLLAEIAEDRTAFESRGHVIRASARPLPSGEWAPRLPASWSEDGRQAVQGSPLHLTEGSPTRPEAEIAALRLGRAWVDDRTVPRGDPS